MGWTLALLVLCHTSDAEVGDALRRAHNEYAFGNYGAAVEQLEALLTPMQLTHDEQVVEARQLLALAYYLTDRKDDARAEFARLLAVAPDFELDPYAVAPPVIEMFESLRRALHPEAASHTRDVTNAGTRVGMLRTIEYRSTQRSALATFLPFGVGQFQNGDTWLGVAFAVTEAALLAANVGCYLGASSMRGFTSEQASTVQALTVAQYSALAAFGLTWGIGAFQARLNFVPVIIETPRVQETPLYGSAR